MQLPVVVLVGRPNVGKSTLFNRLTQTTQALVADYPGLTRDRQYAKAQHQQQSFWVVDTGGIGVEDAVIDALMSKQSEQACQEADVIFFVVDARAGLTSVDAALSLRLRKLNKPVFLLINKTEGINDHAVFMEFQSLGWKTTYLIAAAHGQGVQVVLDDFFKARVVEAETCPSALALDAPISIALVGRPNVGKSTLMNRLIGEERVVVSDQPGTTRDSIMVPFIKGKQHYLLIDTAGVRRRARVEDKIEKFSIIKTLQAIESAQVCLMLLDAQEGVTEQDLHVIGLILKAGKALVVVVNKWDGLSEQQKHNVKSELDRRLQFASFAKVNFISALRGTGMKHLLRDINILYAAATKHVSTTQLTRLLEQIVQQHPPPLVNGRRIKLRYAHLGGHHPLVIVVHGNQLDKLPANYIRYLINQYRIALALDGLPIRLEYKNSDNPYQGKKNPLTPRQVRQRKRLIRKVKQ